MQFTVAALAALAAGVQATYPVSYPVESYPASSVKTSSSAAPTYPASSVETSSSAAATYPASSASYSASSATYPASSASYPASSYAASSYAASSAAVSSYPASSATAVWTTEVVTAYTTFCPAATQITHNGQTYTATEATTLTITNCPCTISKPIYSTSVVACSTCTAAVSSSAAVETSSAPAPVYPTTYANGTTPAITTSVKPTGGSYPTTSAPSTVPTAGAGKAAALSGAGLAGVVGLAALML